MADATESFEWDDAKDRVNRAKHGIAFSEAIAVFLDPALVDDDASHVEDREVRRKALGVISGRIFTLVYTRRGETIRVISARRANAREVRRYGDSQG